MTMNHLSLTRAHDSIHCTIGHSHRPDCYTFKEKLSIDLEVKIVEWERILARML